MKKTILLTVLTLTICSCSKRVYTSASYGMLKSFTEKPIYKGEKVSATYLSGNISKALIEHSVTEDIDDTQNQFALNIHKAISFKNFNTYYGLGASYGKYKFSSLENIIEEGETKDYYNLNLKAGINFTLSTKKIKFRIIGLEFGYHYEFGSYQRKLDQLATNDEVYVNNIKSIPSMNLFSEYVFILNTKSHFSIGSYIGDIILNKKRKQNFYPNGNVFIGSTFSYTYDRYTLSLIIEEIFGNKSSYNFGLSYKL